MDFSNEWISKATAGSLENLYEDILYLCIECPCDCRKCELSKIKDAVNSELENREIEIPVI